MAFLEVVPGKDDPAAYGEGLGAAALPYDYAVFTPGEAREDPCEGMRHHAREREKREKEKAGQGPR